MRRSREHQGGSLFKCKDPKDLEEEYERTLVILEVEKNPFRKLLASISNAFRKNQRKLSDP